MSNSAVIAGFVDEMAAIEGIEKTADMEAAMKGLLVGGTLGAGVTLGGAKMIVEMIKHNKKFAALMGGIMGASLGAGIGVMMPSPPPPPPGSTTIQTGPYAGLPKGTRIREIQ